MRFIFCFLRTGEQPPSFFANYLSVTASNGVALFVEASSVLVGLSTGGSSKMKLLLARLFLLMARLTFKLIYFCNAALITALPSVFRWSRGGVPNISKKYFSVSPAKISGISETCRVGLSSTVTLFVL